MPANIVAWWPAEGNLNDVIGTNNAMVTTGTVGYTNGEDGLGFYFDGGVNRLSVPDSPALDFGPGQDFSIELWIQASPDSPSGVDSIVDKRYLVDSYQSQGYEFGLYQGMLNLRLSQDTTSDGNSWNGGPYLLDGQWHHIAVTVQRGSTTGGNFYVDGSDVLQFDPTSEQGDLTTTASFLIGNHPDPSYSAFFNGTIDELSVYNRALSSDEIAAIYNAGSGGKCPPPPTAPFILSQPTNQIVYAGGKAVFAVTAGGTAPLSYQWLFNGTNIYGANNVTLALTNISTTQAGCYSVLITNIAGSVNSSNAILTVNPGPSCQPPPAGLVGWWRAEGNTSDSAGTNNGIAQGALTYGTGEVDTGFVFDGSTSFVEIPAGSGVNVGISNGFTIEAWINPVSVALERPILEWNTGGYGTHFWISTPGGNGPGCLYANLVDTNGNTHIISSAGNLVATNVYQHAALTYDRTSGNAVIYLNGSVVAQQNLGIFVPQTSYNLYIGYRPTPQAQANFWWGGMDEVSLYGRALSASEIQSIYNAGASGKCFTPKAPSITTQPTSLNVFAGSNVVFTAAVSGTSPLYYQWLFNGTNVVSATNLTLAITNAQIGAAGNYSIKVTNYVGSVTSATALLTVNPLNHFVWGSIPSPRYVGAPFTISLTALDVSNRTVVSYTNTVNLAATNGISISPSISGKFTSGVWTGTLIIKQAATNLVLQANDGLGHLGVANPIGVIPVPAVNFQVSGSTMLFSWPTSYSSFELQNATNLSSTNWQQVSSTPVQLGNQFIVPIQMSGPKNFYRLWFPGP